MGLRSHASCWRSCLAQGRCHIVPFITKACPAGVTAYNQHNLVSQALAEIVRQHAGFAPIIILNAKLYIALSRVSRLPVCCTADGLPNVKEALGPIPQFAIRHVRFYPELCFTLCTVRPVILDKADKNALALRGKVPIRPDPAARLTRGSTRGRSLLAAARWVGTMSLC